MSGSYLCQNGPEIFLKKIALPKDPVRSRKKIKFDPCGGLFAESSGIF